MHYLWRWLARSMRARQDSIISRRLNIVRRHVGDSDQKYIFTYNYYESLMRHCIYVDAASASWTLGKGILENRLVLFGYSWKSLGIRVGNSVTAVIRFCIRDLNTDSLYSNTLYYLNIQPVTKYRTIHSYGRIGRGLFH